MRLTREWQSFRFVSLASQSDDNARVVFDPAMLAGDYWVAGVSFRPGGVIGLAKGESVEDGTMPLFPHAQIGERTPDAQRDWLRFLWETEDRYWQTMRRYLKDDLKAKSLVIGTATNCSTPGLMARMDCVDTHAYWCHPIFPGRPWDPGNWIVANRTMVNERGGTLPDIALRRVLGRPHCVTEYGHAAPNTHVSEGNLLRDAYAALQDWDYVSTSRYAHRANWDLRRIRNFFDMDQHPTRLVTFVAAAALFRRGDVKPARQLVVAALDREREVEAMLGLGNSQATPGNKGQKTRDAQFKTPPGPKQQPGNNQATTFGGPSSVEPENARRPIQNSQKVLNLGYIYNVNVNNRENQATRAPVRTSLIDDPKAC